MVFNVFFSPIKKAMSFGMACFGTPFAVCFVEVIIIGNEALKFRLCNVDVAVISENLLKYHYQSVHGTLYK